MRRVFTFSSAQLFEKKNQKSAQNIAQLQKKLENYQKKVRDIEQGTLPHPKHRKEVLKAVGAGIKDGVKETFNKPKEFAHLIRNKFGSADNIPKDGSWSEAGERRELTPTHHVQGHKRTQSGNIGGAWSQGKQVHRHQGSASLPRDAPASGGSSQPSEHRQSGEVELPSGSDVTSESDQPQEQERRESLGERERDSSSQPWLQSIMDEIHERREECDKLTRELDIQRQHFKQELEYLGGQLREETIRCERLEEAMNDLTELHQNEIENIKVRDEILRCDNERSVVVRSDGYGGEGSVPE